MSIGHLIGLILGFLLVLLVEEVRFRLWCKKVLGSSSGEGVRAFRGFVDKQGSTWGGKE